MRIAFDIGGVIRVDDTISDEMIMSIKLVIDKFKQHNVFIISKAKNKWITKNKEFLLFHNFYEKTGFNIDNVYYVNEYADKRIICDKLEINYMIDDSTKVIRYLLDSNTISIWFGLSNDIACIDKKDRNKVILAKSWKFIRKFFAKLNK